MKICYDTEFLEDGKTISLISIGLVAEDGAEYYAINADMPTRRIRKHQWLMDNVIPQMPVPHGDWRNWAPSYWLFDYAHDSVKRHKTITSQVRDFIIDAKRRSTKPLELWADYAAYDHVALCQLFGTMVNLPSGIPMFTHDLQHELSRRGLNNRDLPPRQSAAHHALYDARHEIECLRFLGIIPTCM